MSSSQEPGDTSSMALPRRCGAGGGALLVPLIVTLGVLLFALFWPRSLEAAESHPWAGREAAIEAALRDGEILHSEKLGSGITRPYRLELRHDGRELRAIWKPLDSRRYGENESFEAEIAAYRLSRALGLDMVPPTVLRRIGRRDGSLQLWIENVVPYTKLLGPRTAAGRWPQQVARMHLFDFLIDNPDRNTGNFLVDEANDRIYLIDHSRAMYFGGRGRHGDQIPPNWVDRKLIERLSRLGDDELQTLLGDVMTRGRIRGVGRLRDRTLDHVRRVEALYGDGAFFVGRGVTLAASR